MSRRLEPSEIDRQLVDLPGWDYDGAAITRSFEFETFPAAIAAVDQIAIEAEAMDHHPDIDIRWRTVSLALSSHDAGGITQLDIELAHQIDAIAKESSG